MRFTILITLLLLALVAGACGGGDDEPSGDQASTTATEPAGGSTQTATAGEGEAEAEEAAPGETAPEGDPAETVETTPPKPDPAAAWREATADRCAGATPDHGSVPELTKDSVAKYSRAQRKVAVARRSQLRKEERPRRVASSVRTLLLNYDLYAGLLDNYGDLRGTKEGDDVVAKSIRDLEQELQSRADRLQVSPCGPLAPE